MYYLPLNRMVTRLYSPSNLDPSVFNHFLEEITLHSIDIGLGLVDVFQVLPRLADLTIVNPVLDQSLSVVDFLNDLISYFHKVPI